MYSSFHVNMYKCMVKVKLKTRAKLCMDTVLISQAAGQV